MKPENKAYLETHIKHLENAREQFFKHLPGEVRLNFERIMSEEFRPGYKADIFCDKCALEMMRMLDIYFRQWKDRQPKPEVIPLEEPGEAIKTAANFPLHKNKKHEN